MNLQENIQRIKEVMGLKESKYLLRRIGIENINSAIEDGLKYESKRFTIDMGLTTFIERVIDAAMDDLHPKLIWGREEFPYDEVYDFLMEKYLDKIVKIYNELNQ
jgi:hypothetical protein